MPKEVDAISRLYDFILWMIPRLEKFPRSRKFVHGDRTASQPPSLPASQPPSLPASQPPSLEGLWKNRETDAD